jgi:hypothetical protein
MHVPPCRRASLRRLREQRSHACADRINRACERASHACASYRALSAIDRAIAAAATALILCAILRRARANACSPRACRGWRSRRTRTSRRSCQRDGVRALAQSPAVLPALRPQPKDSEYPSTALVEILSLKDSVKGLPCQCAPTSHCVLRAACADRPAAVSAVERTARKHVRKRVRVRERVGSSSPPFSMIAG